MNYPSTFHKNSSEVSEFRERMYREDFGLRAKYMNLSSYHDYRELFGWRDDFEDIWRFSNCKWYSADIDQVLILGQRAMSCGSVLDLNAYRAAYFTYTLKAYRRRLFSPLYMHNGFMHFHVKRAFKIGLNEVVVCIYPYNSKMRANIRNHQCKRVGCGLPYFARMKDTGVRVVNGVPQHTFTYFIEDEMRRIERISMVDNILPMADFETVPVTATFGESPEKYGSVVKLPVLGVDPEELRKAFLSCDRTNYFRSRKDIYTIPANEATTYLRYVGFDSSTYQTFSLNKFGSNELKDDLDPYISIVYSALETPVFRQNVAVSLPGWKTKWHRDHSTPQLHGFRLMVPVDQVTIAFREGQYCLEPGNYYFVNNSLPHRGWTPAGLEKRIVFMAQIASDKLILQGERLKPRRRG